MLAHTSTQLFETGAIPGVKTYYDYKKDDLTREHALAGFTMQIAMKESINEYLKREVFNKIGATSNPNFRNKNSIYFAAGYQSSALDTAKIIAAVANDGVYENKTILGKESIENIEKVYPNLKNQTIAFDYVDGKYIKYGNFSGISYFYHYDLSEMYAKYATYISYDPNTSNGFVVNIKYKDSNSNSFNEFNSMSKYFYSN